MSLLAGLTKQAELAPKQDVAMSIGQISSTEQVREDGRTTQALLSNDAGPSWQSRCSNGLGFFPSRNGWRHELSALRVTFDVFQVLFAIAGLPLGVCQWPPCFRCHGTQFSDPLCS
jgi:hypothetical protein